MPAKGISSNVTYNIYDVSGLSSTLLSYPTSPNQALYNDLASGPLIGTYALTPGQSGTTLNLALNPTGVADLNAAISGSHEYFAIGGTANGVPEISSNGSLPAFFVVAALGAIVFERRRSA